MSMLKQTQPIRSASNFQECSLPFKASVLDLCETITRSTAWPGLLVKLELQVDGLLPNSHKATVLRAVDELVSNSMEHGFYNRQRGRVAVHIMSHTALGIVVSVSDDGWGFESGRIMDGNGFFLLRSLGDLCFGAPTSSFMAKSTVSLVISLERLEPFTVVASKCSKQRLS